MNTDLPYPASAFGSIDDFSLSWRWTSPTHAELPPDVMALIHPFLSRTAITLSAEALTRVPSAGTKKGESMACGPSVPKEEVARWLKTLRQGSDSWIILSWDSEVAALMPWRTFSERWSDFCYPSSDDVHIWQPSQEWTLVYEHLESFHFYRQHAARVV